MTKGVLEGSAITSYGFFGKFWYEVRKTSEGDSWIIQGNIGEDTITSCKRYSSQQETSNRTSLLTTVAEWKPCMGGKHANNK